MIGDDAPPYLSGRSGGFVDPLVDFCVNCAICRWDVYQVFELRYCAELCFGDFHDRIHKGTLITQLEHELSFVSVHYYSQVPVHTAQTFKRLLELARRVSN